MHLSKAWKMPFPAMWEAFLATFSWYATCQLILALSLDVAHHPFNIPVYGHGDYHTIENNMKSYMERRFAHYVYTTSHVIYGTVPLCTNVKQFLVPISLLQFL